MKGYYEHCGVLSRLKKATYLDAGGYQDKRGDYYEHSGTVCSIVGLQ